MSKDCMIGVVMSREMKEDFERLAKLRKMSASALVLKLAMIGIDVMLERSSQIKKLHEALNKTA